MRGVVLDLRQPASCVDGARIIDDDVPAGPVVPVDLDEQLLDEVLDRDLLQRLALGKDDP